MRQSQLFAKTKKDVSSDEQSINAQLLTRAGFVRKEMAGVYAYLPLGLRVLENVKQVIREELNKVGGQEVVLTGLQNKSVWEKGDGRWSDDIVDNWFKTTLKNGTELGLAFTHEEPLTNLLAEFVSSHKDLPLYIYQFQTKFRNELRAKSGLLRGREFVMKDLYSFSKNKDEHDAFYDLMKQVYMKIFERLGIGDSTYLTMSNGGTFSKYSFEFQTITDAGEDIILYDEEKRIAVNKVDYNNEIFEDFGIDKSSLNLKEAKSVEIGDIYGLGEKYARAFNLTYADEQGNDQFVYMGSYGIGVPRALATIVEVHHDENGIIWPKEVAPFGVHLVSLCREQEEISQADALYEKLQQHGIEVLYDDRADARPGEKFADSDLIGIPLRLVISPRSIENGGVEWKERAGGDPVIVSLEEASEKVVAFLA